MKITAVRVLRLDWRPRSGLALYEIARGRPPVRMRSPATPRGIGSRSAGPK